MNNLEEVWVKLKMNDRYEVSNYGNVRKKITRRRPYRYLKPETLQRGYSIAIFTDAQIKAIRELSKNGYSQKNIGAKYNVRQSHISMIINRKIWNHI